jgi:hypothetical protein
MKKRRMGVSYLRHRDSPNIVDGWFMRTRKGSASLRHVVMKKAKLEEAALAGFWRIEVVDSIVVCSAVDLRDGFTRRCLIIILWGSRVDA